MIKEGRWFERFAMAAAFAALASIGFCQDPPVPADPPKQEEKEEPPAKRNWISFGTYGWDFSGNRQLFRRYASGPGNYSIRELRLFSEGSEDQPFARFTLRGSPWEDSESEGLIILGGGRASLRGNFGRHTFVEPSQFPTPDSHERKVGGTAAYAITPKIGAFFTYEAAEHENNLELPKLPYDLRTKSFGGGLQGEVFGGNAAVTLVDRRYYDRNGLIPDVIQHQILARYGIPIGKSFTVEGSYADVRIEQNNGMDNSVKNWKLNADWDIGPDTSLLFETGRSEYDLPQVLNSYTQEQFLTKIRLVHHFPQASIQLGYKRREAERIRGDHLYVDVPKWDTFDGRVSTRIAGLRLTAKGSWEHMRDGATMISTDSRALYWDDRVRAQLKLDGGNDRLSGYAVYSYRLDQNDARSTEITNHNLTIGASYLFNERASAYFEIANDTYEVDGFSEDGLHLDDFFPSSVSIAFGFDYSIDAKSSASLALNHYYTRNANPLRIEDGNFRGTELTAVYRRDINADSSFDVTVAPWRYRDRLNDQLDYRTTIFGVNYTVKF
jgi:predicted porin